MSSDQQREQVDREQVEIALEMMEAFHGQALRHPWSDEANAYYHAIGIVEDALDGGYDPDHPPLDSQWQEDLERSREAREEGYRKATLLDERFGEKDTSTQRLLAKLWRVFG